MSDAEGDNSQIDKQEIEVAANATSDGITIEDAIKGVLRIALIHDGLARGLREAVKALATRKAQVCVLVESLTEASYTTLIEALCNEPEVSIPLIKVSDAKQLGEWAGLCQLDRDGNARKVVGCSCVVITNWGRESPERDVLLKYFQSE